MCGIDRGIAQRGERGIGRHIDIGIDPGGLHAAVPDVAIEIGREERLLADEQQAHRKREAEHDEKPVRSSMRTAQRRGNDVSKPEAATAGMKTP